MKNKIVKILSLILTCSIFSQTAAGAFGITVKNQNGTVVYDGDSTGYNAVDLSLVDFARSQFAVFFNWFGDSIDDEVLYVYPKEETAVPMSLELGDTNDILSAPLIGTPIDPIGIPIDDISSMGAQFPEGSCIIEDIEPIPIVSSDVLHRISRGIEIDEDIVAQSIEDEITPTMFNTLIVPRAFNGINNPKFDTGKKQSEEISPFSGELTLRCSDLSLKGRNGLDLNIGRIYQTQQANIGTQSIVTAPDENGQLRNILQWQYSNYFNNRYNLGTGWAFAFPSVEIQKGYDWYYDAEAGYWNYDEENAVYYHTGNGDVYEVDFTAGYSHIKDYYKSDIQFNKDDTGYSNGQVTSFYSMTLADKTKQYFAKDGRLLGIVDRFGNAIKFEHTMQTTTNIVSNGNFKYENALWTLSDEYSWEYSTDYGRYDNSSIRLSETIGGFITSQWMQVEPGEEYTLSASFLSRYGNNVKIEIVGTDYAYNNITYTQQMEVDVVSGLTNWTDYTYNIVPSIDTRYIQIRIENDSGREDLYVDNVTLDKRKPLISRITDTIGRIVTFTYNGTPQQEINGDITVQVNTPDGKTKNLIYTRDVREFVTSFNSPDNCHINDDQRLVWYLNRSQTEDDISGITDYIYEGGMKDGSYIELSNNAFDKTGTNSIWCNKPVISRVINNNRIANYEYEVTRKNLGRYGFYDSLRVKRRYEQYAKIFDTNRIEYVGTLNEKSYMYAGVLNGTSYLDETGYPTNITSTSNLGEEWTTTETSNGAQNIYKFSNGKLITQKRITLGVTTQSDYLYEDTAFKNQWTKLTNTISNGQKSRTTYLLRTYNDWGGVASETKEIDSSILNDAELLEKYKIYYDYDDTYKQITEKRYYINLDEELTEKNIYDNLGRLTKTTDACGNNTYFTYDTAHKGNVVSQKIENPQGLSKTLGDDSTTSYIYDSYGFMPISVAQNYDNSNAEIQYTYEYLYSNPLTVTNPDGGRYAYTYDTSGRVIQENTPSFWGNGYIIEKIYVYQYYPLAAITQYEDIANHAYQCEIITEISAYSDGRQYITSRTYNYYDKNGNIRIIQKENCLNSSTPSELISKYYCYDNFDRLIKVVDSALDAETADLDADGRITKITSPDGTSYVYEYDDVENEILSYYQDGTVQKNHLREKYDIWGNVTRRTAYPNGIGNTSISETYEYDILGNTTKYTDCNGNVTCYAYDEMSRLEKVTLPDGTTALSTYSPLGNAVTEKIYDADSEKFARINRTDERGNKKAEFYNFDNTLMYLNTYEYNAKGNMIGSKEGENEYSYVYDNADNLISKRAATASLEYRYYSFGKQVSASTDQSATSVAFDYDGYGRRNHKWQGNSLLYWEYNSKNLISSKTDAFGLTTAFSYDANGRLEDITADNKSYGYEYYETGAVKSVTYPNGAVTSYTYDNANRVTGIVTSRNGTNIENLSYTYDNNGNVLAENRNGTVTTYTYDSLNRLKTANYGTDTITYEYDKLNNRTSETSSSGDIKTYTYDKFNRLASVSLNGEVTDTYEYNASGALTKHNDTVYTYDKWGKLSKMEEGSTEYNYTYDTEGMRTAKTGTQYLVDDNGIVTAEMDDSGNVTAQMVYGNQALARKTGGNWYYYIYNAHGDVISVLDDAGNKVNNYTYDAWGNTITKTETIQNPIRYAGQYYDEELEQYYLRARYYDPQVGRFTSIDAVRGDISNPLDLNQYVYCRNNPKLYVDTDGEAVALAGGALLYAAGTIMIKIGTGTIVTALTGVAAKMTYDNVINFAKKSKTSGKERATDMPSWAKGQKPLPGEAGKDFAKRLCDERYGAGNYPVGAGSEYNQIKKNGDRRNK